MHGENWYGKLVKLQRMKICTFCTDQVFTIFSHYNTWLMMIDDTSSAQCTSSIMYIKCTIYILYSINDYRAGSMLIADFCTQNLDISFEGNRNSMKKLIIFKTYLCTTHSSRASWLNWFDIVYFLWIGSVIDLIC